jgi:MFS family permease
VGFGLVSLTADLVYEGARSVTGPLLASLGATALVVGVVTGAGEAVALVLRLFFGSLADRTGRYWSLTILGYALTAVCVPLLAVTPFVGGAGIALASALVLAERTGKAIRSPAKSALLADVASRVGLGRGLGVHKALDQIGAFVGPLLVAGVIALTGAIWPALAVLVVPGIVVMILLVALRRRIGSRPTSGPRRDQSSGDVTAPGRIRLPTAFWWFAASSGAATAGLVTFGIISFHLTRDQVLPVPLVPVVYAVGMAAAAVAALATGWVYERVHGRVLLVLPFLVAAVPLLAFTDLAWLAVAGVVVWGAAVGVQDSTVKALVADLVPADRRATAYGVFAGVQGGAAVVGGAAAGALYEVSLPALAVVVAGTQVVALVLLVLTLRRS